MAVLLEDPKALQTLSLPPTSALRLQSHRHLGTQGSMHTALYP